MCVHTNGFMYLPFHCLLVGFYRRRNKDENIRYDYGIFVSESVARRDWLQTLSDSPGLHIHNNVVI